jgi:hypothetical protein
MKFYAIIFLSTALVAVRVSTAPIPKAREDSVESHPKSDFVDCVDDLLEKRAGDIASLGSKNLIQKSDNSSPADMIQGLEFANSQNNDLAKRALMFENSIRKSGNFDLANGQPNLGFQSAIDMIQGLDFANSPNEHLAKRDIMSTFVELLGKILQMRDNLDNETELPNQQLRSATSIIQDPNLFDSQTDELGKRGMDAASLWFRHLIRKRDELLNEVPESVKDADQGLDYLDSQNEELAKRGVDINSLLVRHLNGKRNEPSNKELRSATEVPKDLDLNISQKLPPKNQTEIYEEDPVAGLQKRSVGTSFFDNGPMEPTLGVMQWQSLLQKQFNLPQPEIGKRDLNISSILNTASKLLSDSISIDLPSGLPDIEAKLNKNEKPSLLDEALETDTKPADIDLMQSPSKPSADLQIMEKSQENLTYAETSHPKRSIQFNMPSLLRKSHQLIPEVFDVYASTDGKLASLFDKRSTTGLSLSAVPAHDRILRILGSSLNSLNSNQTKPVASEQYVVDQ